MRLAPALGMVLALTASSSVARAGDAGRLFDEGVKLLDEGRFAEACPKLEESQRLEPAAGTLLNLAGCYEKSGRRAQALSTFRAASEAARARGRADWQRVADEHTQLLTAVLPTITITPSDPNVPLEIRVDGAVAREAIVTVDPGSHSVVASRPGRKPYAITVNVVKSTVVVVPALEPLPPPEPAPRVATGLGTRRAVGVALAGAGLAAFAFAGVGAFIASSALDDAKARCPSYPSRCTAGASAPNEDAETWSTVATISVLTGAALVVGGGALYLVPSSDGARVALSGSF